MSAAASTEIVPSYLGFDFSTQQIKCICTDEQLRIVGSHHVTFDQSLPQYGTKGGVVTGIDEKSGRERVTAPVFMWIEALDLLFETMSENVDFSQVKGLSGCGQMHGTVYWGKNCNETLGKLDHTKSLAPQLRDSFAVVNCPVWVDSSTSEECQELEDAIGGTVNMANITGSKAYERFSGPQIRYMYKFHKEEYEQTERISIVSSFACSLFLGRVAPIDYGDGSGTNLMDVRDFCWNPKLLEACAPGLKSKLNDLVAPYCKVGTISSYWSQKYNFSSECAIAAFTGDNCASVEGLRAKNDDLAVSCGTSDNLILLGKDLKPNVYGHLFVSSLNSAPYFVNLCYKNGSLAREEFSQMYCDSSWETFEKVLNSTPVGNDGFIGLFYFKPEHIPQNGKGVYMFDPQDNQIADMSLEHKIRALVESQFLMKRAHLEKLAGFSNLHNRPRILITGGASRNKSICQIIANVYGGNVYFLDSKDAAGLGNAYRAKFCQNPEVEYDSMFGSNSEDDLKLVANCEETAVQIYNSMIPRFVKIEKLLFGDEI